jgi:hypothetical protein
MTPCALARSPTDSVTGEETVKLPLNFIKGRKFNLIDFGGSLQGSPGCGSQLTKPSELCLGGILKLLVQMNLSMVMNLSRLRCFFNNI